MRNCSLPFLLLLSLAACVSATPPPASQYRQAYASTQLPILFAPGTVRASSGEDVLLRDMRRTMPVQAVATLQASGPLAVRRTNWVAHVLDRPVTLTPAMPGTPVDATTLTISSPTILADACRGVGERELGSIWPANDDVPPRLLPPGCATATALQEQTVRPDDLLVGRPLPPGAATPFAAAIERYYHRNDPAQSNAAQSGGQGAGQSGSGSQEAQGGAAGAAAPGLLVGPLPSGGQAPAQ
jgi:hypothetical protein